MTTQSKVSLQLDKIKFNSNKLAISETSVGVVANQFYQRVLDGEVSAVDTYEAVKFIGDVAEELKKCVDENGKNKFVDLMRSEITAALNGGKFITTKFGTKFSLAETGTKWTYTDCGDPLWNYYAAEIKKLDELRKAREKYLQTITVKQPVGNVLIPQTGELHENVEITPPIKTSISSFKTELLKG